MSFAVFKKQTTVPAESKMGYFTKQRARERNFLVLMMGMVILKKKKAKREYWVHPINQKREEFGEYHRLCLELREYPDRFYTYFRMTVGQFDELLLLLSASIEGIGCNWRKSISAAQRLAVCLRYVLVSGVTSLFLL